MSANGLPAVWEGSWQGEIIWIKADGATETVTMLLHVEPVSENVKTWRIEYKTDTLHSERPYEIAPGKDGSGHFIVDEKNGIHLDCRLFENTLFSQFQVENALLLSRFEHQGEAIAVEIVSFDFANPRRNVSDEERIEVLSFGCRALQRGLLRRG